MYQLREILNSASKSVKSLDILQLYVLLTFFCLEGKVI